MASAIFGSSSSSSQLRDSTPRCGTCENPLEICDGTLDDLSSRNYRTFNCESGKHCPGGMRQVGSRWVCHEWHHTKDGMLAQCQSDLCFQCCPASGFPATAPSGGTATRTDVGSTSSGGGTATRTDVGSSSSGEGDSTLASLPADCVDAIYTLSKGLQETASLKRETVELRGRVTQLTQEVNQTASLKRKNVELQGQVFQLREEVNQTESLKLKTVELQGRLTQLTEEVNQNESLKQEIVELQIQVAEVRESAREKCEALEKEKQALQEKCDQQNGIGIRDLLPDELMAVYRQSLSTATRVASMLKVDDARREAAQQFNDFVCPITHEWMEDPVVASDGHTYDRSQITAWFVRCDQDNKAPTSPKTNAPLENTSLTPNHVLKSLMQTCLQDKVNSLVLTDMQEELSPHKRPRRR